MTVSTYCTAAAAESSCLETLKAAARPALGLGRCRGSAASSSSSASISLPPTDELPSYEFRFETAKLLLELDESVEAASQVGTSKPEYNRVCGSYLICFLCAQITSGAWHPSAFGAAPCMPHMHPAAHACTPPAAQAPAAPPARTPPPGKDERMYPRFRLSSEEAVHNYG